MNTVKIQFANRLFYLLKRGNWVIGECACKRRRVCWKLNLKIDSKLKSCQNVIFIFHFLKLCLCRSKEMFFFYLYLTRYDKPWRKYWIIFFFNSLFVFVIIMTTVGNRDVCITSCCVHGKWVQTVPPLYVSSIWVYKLAHQYPWAKPNNLGWNESGMVVMKVF